MAFRRLSLHEPRCNNTQGLTAETLRGESLELKLSAAAAQRRPRTVRPRRPRTPEIADSAQLGAEQVCQVGHAQRSKLSLELTAAARMRRAESLSCVCVDMPQRLIRHWHLENRWNADKSNSSGAGLHVLDVNLGLMDCCRSQASTEEEVADDGAPASLQQPSNVAAAVVSAEQHQNVTLLDGGVIGG